METGFVAKPLDVKVYGNSGNKNVLDLVPLNAGTVLDIGCGRGDNASHLKKRGIAVDGISISEKELEYASAFLREGFLYDLEKGLPDKVKQNTYDAIICSHVIEHIRDPEKLLEDVKKVMKPGSPFIIALPNIMHYRSRWELLKGNFNYRDSGIWDNTHVKWYTIKSARQLLTDHGYTIIKADVTGDVPFASVLKHITSAGMRQGMFKLFKGISKGFFGYELLLAGTLNKTA